MTEGDRKSAIEANDWLEYTRFEGPYPGDTTIKQHHDIIRCALAQQSVAAGGEVPGGFVVVPVEPTREMLDATSYPSSWYSVFRKGWARMIAAAPKPAHPNDMARENERLREVLERIATASHETVMRDPFCLCHIARYALSTTPSNPPASAVVIVGACKHERLSAMATTGMMSCLDCRWMRQMTTEEFAHWNPSFEERSK